MKALSNLKVAIVCDWLIGIGGAERVILEIHKLFPNAPIYTSQYSPKAIDWFADTEVRTTWLRHLPKALRKFMPALRAWTFSHLDLREYDLVISISGAEAKGVKTRLDATHICYCFTPTHYYWSRYDEYMQNPGFGKFDWLARLGLKILVGPMRSWDKRAAERPNYLITLSTFIESEIKKYYERDSVVIHPPVDVERFENRKSKPENRSGFVVAGRQTPYKRIDLAVAACTKLDLPLTVIGNGPEHAKLVAMAGPSIVFLKDVSDSEMPSYFQTAEALIFPTNVEDFGITAVEALAAGTPVISYKAGGPLDYIKESVNGLFFDEQNIESLITTLKKFKNQKFDNATVAASVKDYSAEKFKKSLEAFIESKV